MKYQLRANNFIKSVDASFEADTDGEAVFKGLLLAIAKLSREKDGELGLDFSFFTISYKNSVVYSDEGKAKDIIKRLLNNI